MLRKKVLAHAGMILLAAGPIFLSLIFYLQLIIGARMGLGAIVFTFWFLVSIYTGRYLVRLLPAGNKRLSGNVLVGLSFLASVCVALLASLGSIAHRHTVVYNLVIFAVSFLALGITIGMTIKLVRNRIRLQLKEANAATEQIRSELQLLQSQLSPHFLFNTLNNLYGISITQHEKVPQLLLKLADLLRYAVYDTHELLVPLEDELAYINNYIDFEKIRLGNRLILHTSIDKDIAPGIRIAPMLLIVFVENAFKHSRNTIAQNISIDIALTVSEDIILFSVKNSQGDQPAAGQWERRSNGLGLGNVKKRLELLYANEYQLETADETTFYRVTLQLKTK